jgi:subtilisin family serine protease
MIVSLLLCGAGASEMALAQDAAPHRPSSVLVKLRDGAGPAAMARLVAAHGASVQAEFPALRLARVQTPTGQEVAVAAALRRQPEVIYAELDYAATVGAGFSLSAQADQPRQPSGSETHAGTARKPAPTVYPNDPELARQWGLMKINAPAAWSIITGAVSITIAVVDSGIDLGHPDLALQLWVNPGEIPGNGVDDDANGKVDDMHGWHFFQAANGPAEDARVQDDFGHGTHVAGIAAAATDNGIGVAGVAWGSRLMAVKVLDQYGNGWYSDIIAGIVYAADNGAQIINLSLGGALASQALCDAVTYAHGRGALVVAATGNSNAAVLYPAACAGALAVAATDRADARPVFSNFGPQVALAAPGVDIYSTWYYTGIRASGYFTKSGTSMATPHVAGAAALLWSQWPAWRADQVRQQLLSTATDVSAPGWDPYSGWGRLNVAAALGWAPRRYYYPFVAAQAPSLFAVAGLCGGWSPDRATTRPFAVAGLLTEPPQPLTSTLPADTSAPAR